MAELYQLRVVLCGVSPLVWRRLLITSETSIAQLHEILQLVFDWSGEHLHRFRIHGKDYGRNGSSGICGTATCSRPCRNCRAWKWIWTGRRLRPRTKRRETAEGIEELPTYVERNQAFIPNYGERYRNGERIASGFVESAVNQVISKRMVKHQQMGWSQRGAHLLLQIRARVLDEKWEATFRSWYPAFRPAIEAEAKNAAAPPGISRSPRSTNMSGSGFEGHCKVRRPTSSIDLNPMIGAIAGDIIGSIYERDGIKTKEFPLFSRLCHFTDDTVLTVAVADTTLGGGSYSDLFRQYYRRYERAGYGSSFHLWARSREPKPYGSFGNGSAMRVSPIGLAFEDLGTVLSEAKRSAEVTHDHPEGIKGAQATAAAVFLARRQMAKDEIRSYIEYEFDYDLSRSVDEIRPGYKFDLTCQGTVPAAIRSFLDGSDFEDTIRNAVSLGGDSDTLACIAGGIAGAYYSVPRHIELEARSRLDDELRCVIDKFKRQFGPRHTREDSLD